MEIIRVTLLIFGLVLGVLHSNAQQTMLGASFQPGGDINGRAALGLCCTT